MRKKLVIANWKAYIATRVQADAFMRRFGAGRIQHEMPEVVFCAPFPLLATLKLPKYSWVAKGAQDVFWEPKGPFTGAVTGAMLKDAGASYVIVGHSERRRVFGETDAMVQKKVAAAISEKLNVVVCVGENEKADDERITLEFLRNEVRSALRNVPAQHMRQVRIAYEPVWAISGGGGEADTPQNAARMIMFLRRLVAQLYDAKIAQTMQMLYGGSVTSKNIAAFMAEDGIDGALVGSASANPKEFRAIISVTAHAAK